MSGHEGRGWGAKRGRTMTGVKMAGIEKKRGETSVFKNLLAPCLKECYERDLSGKKTPSRADLHGGLSRGCSRPDAGSTSVFV